MVYMGGGGGEVRRGGGLGWRTGGVSHELFLTRTFPFGHYLFTVILKWKSSLVCYILVNEYTLKCQFRKCPTKEGKNKLDDDFRA